MVWIGRDGRRPLLPDGERRQEPADHVGRHDVAVDLARGIPARQGADRRDDREQHLHRGEIALSRAQHQIEQAVDHLLAAGARVVVLVEALGAGPQSPVERLRLGHGGDDGDGGHAVDCVRLQVDAALLQCPLQSAGGGPCVAGEHLAARLRGQLWRCHHPAGGPAQQLGLHLGADPVIGDGRDLLQHRPQVSGMQRPGLESGKRAGQPVHQGQ
jgi:hypothetical protein